MSRKLIFLFFIFIIPGNAMAQDYMVELFEEHFREKLIVGGGEVQVYHSLQVKTPFGSKLLVLGGEDYQYRKWLRKSFNNHKLFVVKIPDEGDDRFKYDIAVTVDVQQVHPVWDKGWKCEKLET